MFFKTFIAIACTGFVAATSVQAPAIERGEWPQ